MELKEGEIIQLVNHIGDQEKHFNGLEIQYRLLASTWLLAGLGAIGFLLKDDKSQAVGSVPLAPLKGRLQELIIMQTNFKTYSHANQ